MTVQPGIFALGVPEHCYLELDIAGGADPGTAEALVRRLAGLTVPLSTAGGVNLVVGLRPELWATLCPADAPRGVHGFTDPITGPDGFTLPATQHDAWLWIAGATRTAVFDTSRLVLAACEGLATCAGEVTGWLYRSDRDLTGFIDGTENPSLLAAPAVVGVPAGEPGAGASVVLSQLWRHRTAAWQQAGTAAQEQAMGRTKDDSVELDPLPADSHVARTVLERDGVEQPIFRRNVAYGGVTDHGTVFVGFAAEQWRLHEMLRRMAGAADGVRCALTRYVDPLTGGYYVVPAVEALARFAPEPD